MELDIEKRSPFEVAQMLLHLDGVPFDLKDRQYLKAIYNSPKKRHVYKFSRQSEKCVRDDQFILMSDCSYKKIKDILPGEYVKTVSPHGKTRSNKVIGVFDNGDKHCIRLTTIQHRVIDVTENHPIKTRSGWTNAGELSPGYGISVVIDDKTVCWDRVSKIEDIGYLPTKNLEVEVDNNFIVNGVITHNSTTLSSKMAIYGSILPSFKSLYVSPTSKQTRVFSTVRLKEFLDSPFIKKYRLDKDCDQAVFKKSLNNHSHFFLEYCFLTPDRVRGISSDFITIDEVQDIQTDFIPVIEESASHSKYKWFIYAGTPKTMDNTIEYYWEKSCQNELALKCTHCNKWNINLGVDNIGSEGLICNKCQRSLERTGFRWVSVGDKDAPYDGYHLNQLYTPWTDWKDLLVKKALYSPARFANEVLGMAYDSGAKPVTLQEVMACCADRPMADGSERFSSPMFGGIDWSVTSDVSYTVLTIGEYQPFPNKFKIHYAKAYNMSECDPRVQISDIIKTCKKFNVAVIGADWGAGSVQNLELAKVFGANKIIQFYHTGNQQERVRYNSKRWIYTLNRTFVMTDFFLDIQKQKIEFFNWQQFRKPFAEHILNVYTDTRKQQQRETLYYDHRVDKPDDALHSAMFCKLAGDIFYSGRAI